MTECLEFSQYIVLRKYGAANSSAVATHEGLFICALSPLVLRLISDFTKEEIGAWKVKWLSQGQVASKYLSQD